MYICQEWVLNVLVPFPRCCSLYPSFSPILSETNQTNHSVSQFLHQYVVLLQKIICYVSDECFYGIKNTDKKIILVKAGLLKPLFTLWLECCSCHLSSPWPSPWLALAICQDHGCRSVLLLAILKVIGTQMCSCHLSKSWTLQFALANCQDLGSNGGRWWGSWVSHDLEGFTLGLGSTDMRTFSFFVKPSFMEEHHVKYC